MEYEENIRKDVQEVEWGKKKEGGKIRRQKIHQLQEPGVYEYCSQMQQMGVYSMGYSI